MLFAACISWIVVEQPLRRGQFLWPARWKRFAYAGIGSLGIAAIGVITFLSAGFPQRLTSGAIAVSLQANDFSPLRARCHATGAGNLSFVETCVSGPGNAHEIIVFADSHGVELSYALSEVADSNTFKFRQVTGSACPPAYNFNTPDSPGCSGHVARMVEGLRQTPSATVIMTAFYSSWAQPKTREAFWAGFERVMADVRSAGHKVIVLGEVPPHSNGKLPDFLARWILRGRDPTKYLFPVDTTMFRDIDERIDISPIRTARRTYP